MTFPFTILAKDFMFLLISTHDTYTNLFYDTPSNQEVACNTHTIKDFI